MKLRSELVLVHLMFHVSKLEKCIGDAVSILPINVLGVDENLSYEGVLVEILDRLVKNVRNKEVASINVLRRKYLIEVETWEVESYMKSCYRHLYGPYG